MDSDDDSMHSAPSPGSPKDVTMESDGEAPIPASTRNMLEEDLAVSGSDSESSGAGSGKNSKSASPKSASPKSVRSGASSRSSRKSRSRSASSGSGSPGSAKRSSRSNSPKSNHSGGSRRSSPRSRGSSSGSGSRSPGRASDKGSHRSRSGSPRSGGSGSERGSAKHSSRSRSRSGSESPGSRRPAKRSPARSRSGSPKSPHSDESDGGERIPERSPPRFDPTDSESGGSKPGSPKPNDDRDQDKENEEGAGDIKPEEEEEILPETRIDVEIPKITTDLGKSVHFVKLPNFLSVETRPFDPNTYEDEIDDEETLDEEGRARLKLKVENTIRWREKFNEKGVFVKESNARFVRWSDGSLSLHLGDEIFNVERQALHGDHNHLFIRQGTGLQGQAVFRTKLTFRPHSTESFTHRKMTMSLADRSTKAQGIKVLSTVGADPEAQRDVLIKKEEDKLRASVRRENKQRRVRERGTKGLSTSYLDDEYSEEENSISLAAIKNRYKKGGVRAHIYSSDEDDGSDLEQGRKLEKAKRLKDSEDEDGDKSDVDGEGKSPPAQGGKGDSPIAGPSTTAAVVSSSAMDSD